MNEYDVDADGYLDFEEFIEFMKSFVLAFPVTNESAELAQRRAEQERKTREALRERHP